MTLKKFTLAILLTFTLTIAYQVFAAYLTSPENLRYPNPGHYPGEIGPGTFNCSNNTNCFWKFPNALFINSTSGKVGIGTENPTETLEVQGNTKIQGNLEVTGKGNFFELCIQGNCTTFWPVAGAGGGIGGFKDCEIVEKECCCCASGCIPSCDVSCPSDKWLISGGGRCGNTWGGTKGEGIFESYPKTAGKGGAWHIWGYGAYVKHNGSQVCSCVKAYALCCNFTEGAGTVEDIWVNETGDTMTGDLKVEGGIVVGNPAGGNKGPGTINAQKIYVNGSEVSKGLEYRGYCHSVEYYHWSSAHGVTIDKTPAQACQDAGYTYTGDNGVCLVHDTGDQTGTKYVLSKCNLDCGCWDTGNVRSCIVYCCE